MNAHATLDVVLADRRAETPGIAVFELQAPEGGALPAFTAGAHVDVHLPNGLVRQYSLCNAPSDGARYLLGVQLAADSRGGSRAMHEQLAVGARLRIGAPRNLFALQPQARHSVLVAAGIGITPILSMAEHLSESGQSFELHYVVRSIEAAAFLPHIRASAFAHRLQLHLGGGASAPHLSPSAFVPAAHSDHHLYVCGPGGFMDAVFGAARERGWAAAQLHQEHFGAAPPARAAGSFELLLARSGRRITVAPEQSAVQALAAAGVVVPTSCEQGVCGTCLTRVLDGVPEHQDLYLSPDEQAANDQFLPCCSRARTACLTLDL